MSNNRNVMNISRLLHEYCHLRVSQEAIQELSGRVIDKLYDLAPEFDKTAEKHGRKTIFAEDIIEVLGVIDRNML